MILKLNILVTAILFVLVAHAAARTAPPVGWPDQIHLDVSGAVSPVMNGEYELYFDSVIAHYVNGDRANPWMRLLPEWDDKPANRATGWLFYDEGWPGSYYEHLFAGEMTARGFAVTWASGEVTITGPGNIPEPSILGAVMLAAAMLRRPRVTRRAQRSESCRSAPSPCSC